MKRVACVIVVALLLSGAASAQSLGEAARLQRAQKKAPVKPARVYTNDNLPREGGLSTTALEAKAEQKASEAPGKPSSAELEKTYRAKAATLREALAKEEKKLDDMQKQWNLGRQRELDQQKAAVDAAKKAIEDFEEDMRKKGLPPGWAR